jgi:hypothetical protein
MNTKTTTDQGSTSRVRGVAEMGIVVLLLTAQSSERAGDSSLCILFILFLCVIIKYVWGKKHIIGDTTATSVGRV